MYIYSGTLQADVNSVFFEADINGAVTAMANIDEKLMALCNQQQVMIIKIKIMNWSNCKVEYIWKYI